MSNPLQDFFALIAEEKRKQEEANKPKVDLDNIELDIRESISNIYKELEGKEVEPIEEAVEPVEETPAPIPERSLLETTLDILRGTNTPGNPDPLTPTDQKFVTIEDLNKHYNLFVSRVQHQLSTLGGGGETKFLRLDDVNERTANDNWVLEYDAESKVVKFTNQIGPVDYVRFDTTHTHEEERVAGTLCWDPEDETLNLVHPGDVVQQIGQESYAKIRNRTGSTIFNGQAVRFAGAEMNGSARLLAAPFRANNEFPTLYGLGIATQDIADSTDGRITVWGKVRDVNTSGFNVGDILYVSPDDSGGLTNIRPTAPNNVIPMAAVLRVDSSQGEIFVRPNYEQQKNYAQLYSGVDQTLTAINTPKKVKNYSLDFAQQFVLDSATGSQIICKDTGLYAVNVNAQVLSTNSSAKDVYMWLRKNDSDVPFTTRKIQITGNLEPQILSAVYSVSLAIDDYVEILWAASDTTVRFDAAAATAFSPSAPSVLVDIMQVAL